MLNKIIFIFCQQYCAKALKPGGSIFITTLNKTIPSFLGGIVCAEYILRAIPIGTHEWSKFISPEDTQRLLDQRKNLVDKKLSYVKIDINGYGFNYFCVNNQKIKISNYCLKIWR